MAIKTKKESENTNEFKVTISRVKAFDDNNIACDLTVNGVSISGCVYRQGVKDGKDYAFISFPSRKNEKDGKYYNHAYFPISDDLLNDIEKQIEELLNK